MSLHAGQVKKVIVRTNNYSKNYSGKGSMSLHAGQENYHEVRANFLSHSAISSFDSGKGSLFTWHPSNDTFISFLTGRNVPLTTHGYLLWRMGLICHWSL